MTKRERVDTLLNEHVHKNMPKVLRNAKTRILEAAKSELSENDFAALSMRSVAEKAGVAVGTLYHYFADKLSLVAALVCNDWETSYRKAEEEVSHCRSIDELVDSLYKLMIGFSLDHKHIFENYKDKSFPAYYLKLRPLLIDQMTSLWKKGLVSLNMKSTEEASIIVPEIILIAAREKRISEEVLISMIQKII